MKWRIIHFAAMILIIAFCILTFLKSAKSSGSFSNSVNNVLYRVFELEVINNTVYDNKFTDVELTATYTSPSGKIYNFPGFFDGDGNGGGDYQNGNVWKLRFMPNELGNWTYEYRWSDTTTGGKGTINCTSEGAGKGILKPYQDNPRWFAYNGTHPVWLKSYYETGHGSIGQDFDWIVENVYSRLVNAGYNHLQVNWLLSLCCFQQYYLDGPEPEITDMTLYQNGRPYTSMKFDIWYRMERHLGWLNDHDVGVHMFLGVEGDKNDGPAWDALSSEEKEWFTKYIVARLAPFANLAGWNFVWEVPGDRENYELGFARFIQKYDIFNHLRTYEDEAPRENEYHSGEYTFAAIENHYIHSWDRSVDRPLWKEPWTHHEAYYS